MKLDSTKTVTVFGGSGFLGHSIVKRLAATGARLRIASRTPREVTTVRVNGNVGQISAVGYKPGDAASIAAAVAGSDAVFNLVGVLSETRRASFRAVHVELAERIAQASAAAGVQRLVHLSAIGASATAKSGYGRSKASGEAAVLRAFPAATILRPSIVFGPEDGFFNLFATLARYSPMLPVFGGGKTRFQPVYVGDVADAALRVLSEPATAGRIYELGGPGVYSFRELLELVLQTTKRDRVIADFGWGMARLQAKLLQHLPGKPLTPDQVLSLQSDNVVAANALGFAELGIRPVAVESIVPTYLERFRPGGAYGQTHQSA